MTDSPTRPRRGDVFRRTLPRGTGVFRRTRPRGALSVGAVAVLAVVGCSGSDDDATSPSSVGVVAAPATVAPSATTEPVTSRSVDSEPVDSGPVTTEPVGDEPDDTPSTADVAAAYDFSAIGPVVDRFVADRGLSGAGLVVVERDDGVVHEQYWGGFDEDRVSLIASSSKMIVAGVLLAQQDAGLLDIDAPVADVVDWGAGNPTITPAQLLSNSSGLPGLFPEPGYAPYLCQYLAVGTLQDCAAAIFTSSEDDPDVIPPDTEFRYGGAQWQVAGAVAEAVAGRSWAELVEETYVDPCGVDSLAFNNHWTQFGAIGFDYPVDFAGDPSTLQPTENPNMEGGAYITAPDYGALLLMHLRDGRCGDTQVLSPEALEVLHADRTGPTYGSPTSYALGWFVDAPADRIFDPGAYGAVPWLDLADGYGAYLVIEADSTTGNELAAELYPLVEAAINAAP